MIQNICRFEGSRSTTSQLVLDLTAIYSMKGGEHHHHNLCMNSAPASYKYVFSKLHFSRGETPVKPIYVRPFTSYTVIPCITTVDGRNPAPPGCIKPCK